MIETTVLHFNFGVFLGAAIVSIATTIQDICDSIASGGFQRCLRRMVRFISQPFNLSERAAGLKKANKEKRHG